MTTGGTVWRAEVVWRWRSAPAGAAEHPGRRQRLRGKDPAISPRRTIHTQGDLDGACFLYAIANAYTAITGEVPTLKEWGTSVRELPHLAELIDPTVGTRASYENAPKLLVQAAEQLLSGSSDPSVAVEWLPAVRTWEEVADLIDERSVVVLRYRGASRFAKDVDHWVCAVASEAGPTRLHVACSIRWSDVYRFTEGEYEELEVSFGRRANDSLGESSAELVAGSVLVIRAA